MRNSDRNRVKVSGVCGVSEMLILFCIATATMMTSCNLVEPCAEDEYNFKSQEQYAAQKLAPGQIGKTHHDEGAFGHSVAVLEGPSYVRKTSSYSANSSKW